MSGGSQQSKLDDKLRRYQALCEVAESITAHRDLSSLLQDLKERLQSVVRFDAVQVVLHDSSQNLMRRHILESPSPGDQLSNELAIEESPSGGVWQTQQPILVTDLDAFERRYPRVVAEWRQHGVKTVYLLPLTSLNRQLGALGFISGQEAAWSEDEQEFLRQVAKMVAVAVDNALNFESARASEAESKYRLERLRLMLKITTTVVAQLDLQELLKVISSSIREAIEIDVVTVSLFDHESGQLRTIAIDAAPGNVLREIGFILPLEGTPGGFAFTSGQPVILDKMDLDRFPSEVFRQVYELGYRSGGSVPLITQGRKLGVLGFASKRESGFSESDKELLCQIANQVAIAVDNALNFDRARKAEQQAIRQLERERLMLEINNAVVSKLDLHELVRVVSSCLREALQLDITSVSLYNPQSNEFRAYLFDLPDILPPIEEGTPIPFEGTIGGVSLLSGRPIFINHTNIANAQADFDRRLIEAGIKSGGCVPLVVHERKLGILAVGSFREDAFSQADQELLCQAANQVAIAVENSLNFERAQQAERQAAAERDRANLLLEVNNAIISHLDISELVKRISASLLEILPHDSAGIALYDEEREHLREYANIAYEGYEAYRQGEIFPLAGTAVGQVFRSGEPLLLGRLDAERFPADRPPQAGERRPRSACLVPLMSHGRRLGVLGVGRYEEDRFTEGNLEQLGQIAGQVAIAVENALAYSEIEGLKNKLTSEKLYLEEEIRTEHNFEELIGDSRIFKRLLKQVETVAPTDSAVLIRGETGTGKELLARAIHDLSTRCARTLVKLNCAAIPTGLLESELFGHERGAFTGAISQRIGRFELANHGTLFLDEVGDIPLELQPKLLRVLQEQEFERLGSTRTQKVNVRLIAATNCDLEQMVAEKKYRSDLYYRLNVFPITIPPLRERREDIPALTRFFTQKYARRLKKQVKAIPAETLELLTAYAWPGNVRELEHFIERAVILTTGPDLRVSSSELKATETAPTTPAAATLQDAEREHIRRVLEEANWVIGGPGGAAARLGVKRSTLQSRMQKLGISRPN
jgi:formate hydrogenlyase transcriptional activator